MNDVLPSREVSGPGQRVVSIVVPCFNEQDAISHTLERLLNLAPPLGVSQFEYVFVDDGSQDGTLEILRAAAKVDDRVRVISLSRNFGHQFAVTAGISASSGHSVALIDADLQDPPEVLLEMIELWLAGYDVVYGVRREREGESRFKLGTARMFYRLLNRLSEVSIPLDTGDFRIMDRSVVDALSSMPERHRFVRGMVAWVGFRQLALSYDRKKRIAGVSKYPLRKMIRFASDGILSFSSIPLRLASMFGAVSAVFAAFGIMYALFMRIFTATWVEGWTVLMITVFFIGGVQLLSIGMIGEYVGRIYEESKRRPLYFVKERIGFRVDAEVRRGPADALE
jgi:glycosyltransferase involved in cell wall biosynthesis